MSEWTHKEYKRVHLKLSTSNEDKRNLLFESERERVKDKEFPRREKNHVVIS